jgi:dynein heavy chain 1
LGQVQKVIDHLNLENYSNLDVWVASLNDKIDTVLKARLVQAIEAWCVEFVKANEGMMNGDGPNSQAVDKKVCPSFRRVHKLMSIALFGPDLSTGARSQNS